MPGRTPDVGVKRFELRTGIGGLPTLGGMFRSGDPAVTPPHKFHLLVNMRRTPGGMITRPGLELEFDTGIEECIQGLTEDAGEQGAALMLYPGASPRPGNGTSAFNTATFRSIFPDSSATYSEFLFALYGPASAVRGNPSPVIAYHINFPLTGPKWLSRPFLFRGQACQFVLVDRNGVNTVALAGINPAQRSFLSVSDCFRDAAGPSSGFGAGGGPCPGLAGSPPVPGNDPPLWPYQHPVGSVGILTYFDNPFSSGDWRPDADAFQTGFGNSDDNIDLILTRQERSDDQLSSAAGVSEVLYFVARQNEDNAPPVHRRLVRWDGAQQTTEFAAIPDNLIRPALGEQPYGPYLCSGDASGGASDWAAVRQPDGTWSVIDGVGWTVGVGATEYAEAHFLERGLSWGGKGQALIFGRSPTGGIVFAMAQKTADFEDARGAQSCTLLYSLDPLDDPTVYDAVIAGSKCYAIGVGQGGNATNWYLWVGDFQQGAVGGDGIVAAAGVLLSVAGGTWSRQQLWIQAVGDRVFVGGHFVGWDPELGAADLLDHHGVYDVTGTLHDTPAVSAVYRVNNADQQEDSGNGHEGERYSLGALPAVPNDDAGGQGFQAS